MSDLGSFIIVGNTQAGKSSFINFLAGSQVATVGTGNGTSATIKSTKYAFHSPVLQRAIQIIDMPGFGDTRLAISNQEIALEIKNCIVESLESGTFNFKGFLLVESLQNESLNIVVNLERIYNIAGIESQKSILVVATKSDLIPVLGPQKHQKLLDFCQVQNLKCTKWSSNTKKITPEEIEQQVIELKSNISSVIPYDGRILNQLNEEIAEAARELCNSQKIYTQEDINNKAQELANNAPKVPVTRFKMVKVMKTKTISYPVSVRRGGPSGWFGGTKTQWHSRNESYWVEEQVPYTEDVPQSSQAFLAIATEQLKPLPVEHFTKDASKIVSERIRATILRD
jgi:GTP-binding protein EngB required for normal cell division